LKNSKALASEHLAELAETALDDMKGQEIRSISVKGLTSITDFMVIATGSSTTHVKALADSVDKAAKEAGQTVKSIEGKIAAEWVLVDLGDVVVHLMVAPMRALYNLEELWSFKPPAVEITTETAAEHEA
jgi:ribosome-associated protein